MKALIQVCAVFRSPASGVTRQITFFPTTPTGALGRFRPFRVDIFMSNGNRPKNRRIAEAVQRLIRRVEGAGDTRICEEEGQFYLKGALIAPQGTDSLIAIASFIQQFDYCQRQRRLSLTNLRRQARRAENAA